VAQQAQRNDVDGRRQVATVFVRSALSVLVITVVLLVLTQWWSGLDTPDSEFYASLAIFTDQVTDRAPQDSYYWTRLGYITPVHILTSIFGIWTGFAAYKALLLLIITSSIFAITRQRTNFWAATWLTAATASSSVVLAYLGNPYLTATVLAGTAATIALVLRTSILATIGAGLALGWTAMAYPSGALLAGVLWLGLFIYTVRTKARSPQQATRAFITTAVVTLLTLIAFEISGRLLFPGLDWLGTYIEWSSFDHSRYASGESVWLRDISLLVPASILIISTVNRIRGLQSPAADTAVIISASSIGFFGVYAVFHGAQFLEAPMLQAMLWPPALIALALVAASRSNPAQSINRSIAASAIFGLIAIIVAGRFDPNLPFIAGVAIASIITLTVIAAPRSTLATVISISIFLTGAQLLQNSREAIGQFPLDPYTWAYQPNPNGLKLRTAVDSQQWLIDNTNDDDQLLLWVEGPWTDGDRELYTVASMQLWGENLLTLSPTVSDQATLDRLNTIRQSVVAMYGKSMDAVLQFWTSIPQELRPTAPVCYDYTWPIDPTSDFPTTTGHTCLTRLSW
jgi:hypothetical protein